MNVSGFSTPALLEFHSKIKECLKKDDENPYASKDYGVREFADWKQLADAIASELRVRHVSYSPINWHENKPG